MTRTTQSRSGVAFSGSMRLATLSFGAELLGGLTVAVLLARALGPEGFGAYGLWFGLATLTLLIFDAGVGPALTVEMASGRVGGGSVRRLFYSRLGTVALLVPIGGMAVWLITPGYWLLGVAVIASEALGYCVWLAHYAQRALLKEGWFLSFLVGDKILIAGSVGLVIVSGIDTPPTPIAIAIVISRLVMLVASAVFVRSLPHIAESSSGFRRLARAKGLSGMLVQFTERGAQYVLPVLVVLVHGAAIGGGFQAAMKLLALPAAFNNSVAKATLPRLADSGATSVELRRLRMMLLGSAVIVGLVAGIAFLVAGNVLVGVVFGESYSGALGVLRTMAFWPLAVSMLTAMVYIGLAAGLVGEVRWGNLLFLAAIALGVVMSVGSDANFFPLVICGGLTAGLVLYRLSAIINRLDRVASASMVTQ